VLGWHRALVRRKWAAYLGRPRRGRPRTSTKCRQLIVRMAKKTHAQTLGAADFFSVDTVLFKRLYVLIYVHLATRRALLASCTARCLAYRHRHRDWFLRSRLRLAEFVV
jgi:hypothetical protein